MSFKEQASSAFDKVSAFASDAFERGKIEAEKVSVNHKIRQSFAELGKLTYTLEKSGTPDDTKKTELVKKIDELYLRLAVLENL